MANYMTNTTELTSIANAIRTKGGTSADLVYPSGFVTAIQNIPSGGNDRLPDFLSTSPTTLDLSNDTFTTLRVQAFYYLSTLVSISLPQTLTSIGQKCFANSGIKSITLPNSLTSIGNSAFENCSRLASVTPSTELRTIGSYSFASCTSLTSVNLSNTKVYSIGDQAFNGDSKLTEVLFPTTLTTIGASLFSNCKLNSADLSQTQTTTLGNLAFSYCPLESGVTLPTTLTTIGHSAFKGSKFTKIWIPISVTTIVAKMVNTSPFNSCTLLTDIYCEATEAPSGWGAYWNYTSSSVQATVHWGVSKAEYDAL